jgi:HSP20 family protein
MSTPQQPIRVAVGRSVADPGAAAEGPAAGQLEHLTPLIDIHEGPDGLVLEADLPGVTDEGLTVQLEDNVLSLYATPQRPAFEGARIVHEECRPGAFVRSFILSDEVDRGRISAELKNGVLRIDLPRAERARTRRIEVRSS